MRYLRAWIDLPEQFRHPMQAFIRETDAVEREEMLTFNLAGDADHEYLLFRVYGDRERYRDAIDDVDSVAAYRMSPSDDGVFHVYVVQECRAIDRDWRAAFRARNLVTVPPVVFDDRGRMRMTILGAEADITAAIDDQPPGVDVTVVDVGDYDRYFDTPASGLTDRQREAVRTALAMGYYDVPATCSLAEVAATLDVAEATASELVARGERAILDDVLGRGPS
ncbi:helix-turn-helix domain-containing protein [Halococcoides cellulosivorans]|uniref:Bacterio-opsin activator n=1 Tax=Halococcoides cellulosivorans TaxID=1679096 RepID=A0A2R4WZJ2_9EURY|nr:helix-turn-helix domain-containing protein [Halococcoides cellulosivorans]AWB26968.1 bacterio-opsin activator [Halococcoides cellulosivorans]